MYEDDAGPSDEMAVIMGFSGFGSKKKWQTAAVECLWTVTEEKNFDSIFDSKKQYVLLVSVHNYSSIRSSDRGQYDLTSGNE